MLSDRQLSLLVWAKSRRCRSLDEMAYELRASRSTVLAEIRAINLMLPPEDHLEIKNRHLSGGKVFSESTERLIEESLRSPYRGPYARSCEVLSLLLFEESWVSLEYIARRLNLSKTAVHNSVHSSSHIGSLVEISPTCGIRFKRDVLKSEFSRRCELALCLLWNSRALDSVAGFELVVFSYEDVGRLVGELVSRSGSVLSETAQRHFSAFVYASAIRVALGYRLDEAGRPGEVLSEEVREICARVEREAGIKFDVGDIQACDCVFAHGSLMQDKDGEQSTQRYWNEFLVGYWKSVAERFGLRSGLDHGRIASFARHLVRLERRCLNGSFERGELKREVQRRFPFATHLARQDFIPSLPFPVSEAEVAGIIMHIEAELEGSYPNISVLLVTTYSPACAQLYAERIENRLSSLNSSVSIVPTYRYDASAYGMGLSRPIVVTCDRLVAASDPEAILTSPLPERDELTRVIDSIMQAIRLRKNESLSMLLSAVSDETVDTVDDLDIDYAHSFVCDTRALVCARFAAQGEPSWIRRIRLKHPFKYRFRSVELVIDFAYNPADGDAQSFYRLIRESISPERAGWS